MLDRIGKITEKSKKEIQFHCIQCNVAFLCDVGGIEFETEDRTPRLEKPVICPDCGVRYQGAPEKFTDHFEVTELGQSQLTELFLGDDFLEDDCDEDEICPSCGELHEFPFFNWFFEEPYIRGAIKIGRNESCPLGAEKSIKSVV
jgi:hypothetical protein